MQCQEFSNGLIDDIPAILDKSMYNEARRFITLIDIIYEKKIT